MVRNQGWVFALHSLRALSFISDTEQEQQQERLLSTAPKLIPELRHYTKDSLLIVLNI